jgi:hypothetical protein
MPICASSSSDAHSGLSQLDKFLFRHLLSKNPHLTKSIMDCLMGRAVIPSPSHFLGFPVKKCIDLPKASSAASRTASL